MVSDVRSLLAEKIKWHRERSGLSQRALADALRVDKATIWRAEQGDSWPDYKTLEGIAGRLGVGVDEFFSWAEPSAAQALEVIARELETRRETPARNQLADRIAKLGPEAIQAVEALLSGLEDLPSPDHAGKRPTEKRK
jgi:transcriptional regulator with XRE-family HTH domain